MQTGDKLLPGAIEPLWTVEDAAKYLRKSKRWVQYALLVPETEPGSMPHIRIGRNVRFEPAALREWIVADCPPAATLKKWRRKP